MLIPRHWAHIEGVAVSPNGSEIALSMWGCSPTSVADARGDAQRRFEAARRRVEEGRLSAPADDPDGDFYPYGRSLLREHLLEEIAGMRGGTVAIRTRNRYGAEVLNAANALFLDIDSAAHATPGLVARVLGLFGGKRASGDERGLERLRAALASRAAWRDASFRIYRTAAGFRVLLTDRLGEPGSAPTEELMRDSGTDARFITLCRVQKCFRARLTPKPFRIGLKNPPTTFPFASAADEARMRTWLDEYRAKSEPFAVCRLVEEVGPKRVHADLARVLEVHDRATRATSDLPLA